MPYIKQEFRGEYERSINYMLDSIKYFNDPFEQLDKFYYFSDRLFCVLLFQQCKDVRLNDVIDDLADTIKKKPVLDQLGDINYILSSVSWSLLNGKGYGFRCALKSKLEKIVESLENASTSFAKSSYASLYKSAVTDVILETYRRRTVPYEDEKILENGDVNV